MTRFRIARLRAARGRRSAACLPLVAATFACSAAEAPQAGTVARLPPAAAQPEPAATPLAAECEWRASADELAERASPPDSLRFRVGDAEGLLCYSRPSARGRVMIGGESVPYGEVWRTGANEPTTLHLGFAASVAGVAVEPGTYALYTVPGPSEWEILVNRSTEQWGAERYYTEEVEAQEAGRGSVAPAATDAHVETLTFDVVPATEDAVELVLSWEASRVSIPIRRLR
jgi:hypothetical protein